MSPPKCERNRNVPRSVVLFLLAVLTLAGCQWEMADQPRVDPLEGSAFFDDGLGARQQVAGTIARGQSVDAGPAATGRENGQPVAKIPVDVTPELLNRGRQRFGIFCRHCHGFAGAGDGMVVQRGFPRPPSYHLERLRKAPDGQFFAVITDGHGKMPAFRGRIEPDDRWAIVGYIRALQLSQHADINELSPADRTALEAMSDNSAAAPSDVPDDPETHDPETQ